jgi:hypothetical protein
MAMTFPYSHEFINLSLAYTAYRQRVRGELPHPLKDEAAKKMHAYVDTNVVLMNNYDTT